MVHHQFRVKQLSQLDFSNSADKTILLLQTQFV